MANLKQITLMQLFSTKEKELMEFAERETLTELWSQKASIGEEYEKTRSLELDALIFTTTELLSAYRKITVIFQEELDILNEIKAEMYHDFFNTDN